VRTSGVRSWRKGDRTRLVFVSATKERGQVKARRQSEGRKGPPVALGGVESTRRRSVVQSEDPYDGADDLRAQYTTTRGGEGRQIGLRAEPESKYKNRPDGTGRKFRLGCKLSFRKGGGQCRKTEERQTKSPGWGRAEGRRKTQLLKCKNKQGREASPSAIILQDQETGSGSYSEVSVQDGSKTSTRRREGPGCTASSVA